MDVALTMVDRGGGKDWHLELCTPRCAYDWWRDMLASEYGQDIEPDLLVITAHDLYDALEGYEDLRNASDEQLAQIIECWARLGHVLGQLDLTPKAES